MIFFFVGHVKNYGSYRIDPTLKRLCNDHRICNPFNDHWIVGIWSFNLSIVQLYLGDSLFPWQEILGRNKNLSRRESPAGF